MIEITDPNEITALKEIYDTAGARWDKFNIFGIQNDESPNTFNDTLGIATDEKIILCIGTTQPGKNATEKKAGGADHLGTGFHEKIWFIEYGQRYGMEVFKQIGKVFGFHDANRNYVYDESDPTFQKAGPEMACWGHSTKKANLSFVNDSSWMCQVWKYWREFEQITAMAKASGQARFSYLLMPLNETTQQFYITEEAA